MIIQSSNVAMTSRRSYERTSAVSSSLSLWGGGVMRNSNLKVINRYSEKSDSGKSSSYPNTGDSKDDLFHQFKQAQSIGSPVSMTSRTTPDMHTIKSQSINYLMMLLFGKGNIFQNRFLSSGLSAAFSRCPEITQKPLTIRKQKKHRFPLPAPSRLPTAGKLSLIFP